MHAGHSELAIIRLLASHTIHTMNTANLQYAGHADELTSDSICHRYSVCEADERMSSLGS